MRTHGSNLWGVTMRTAGNVLAVLVLAYHPDKLLSCKPFGIYQLMVPAVEQTCMAHAQVIDVPRCKFPLQLILVEPQEMAPLMYAPSPPPFPRHTHSYPHRCFWCFKQPLED